MSGLVAVMRVAARYGVPIQLHWEFGNNPVVVGYDERGNPVYDDFVDTAQRSWEQLKELLAYFPNVPFDTYPRTELGGPELAYGPVKVIVAHCGKGPEDTMTDEMRTTYKERMVELLGGYPNVYFDRSRSARL